MLAVCEAPAVWPDPNAMEEVAPTSDLDHLMADVGVVLRDPATGVRYLFKWGEEDGRAEEIAWLFAQRLDLNVPAAKACKRGHLSGALMRVVEGAQTFAADASEYGTFPDRWYRELTGQSVLEYVLCDNDRHDANYLLRRGSIVAIDHAYALRDEGAEPRSVSEYLVNSQEWGVYPVIVHDYPEALLCAIRPADVRRYLDRLMAIPEDVFRRWVRQGSPGWARTKVLKEATKRRRLAQAEFGQLFTEIIDRSKVVPPYWRRWRSLPSFD